ncbi:MAG: gliding motility-associated protein GldE [Saprospiraceae bacterium]|nr:gliding motility-associated protein GldE [Saprospiraceae bacterium]
MDSEPPNILFILFQTAITNPSDGLAFSIFFLIVLLTCSGLISSSEVAYFSLGLKDIKALEEENSISSRRALALKEKPRYLLATILISNNFVNIAIVIVAEQILRIWLGPENLIIIGQWLHNNLFYGLANPDVLADIFNFLVTVVGVTFMLVLFGEAMPKIYATLNKLRIVHLMALPLTVLKYLLSPFSKILVNWSSAMEKSLNSTNTQSSTTKEDIDAAIDLTVTNKTEASVQEADILKGIVNFGDIAARQIMHPRMDIIAIEYSESFKDLMKIVKDSGYSRLPVYKEDLDNIIGILYVKDLLEHTEKPENYEWQKLIRSSVLFVPESKKIDELLREFQLKRTHMAVIVDEYGGTAGIATLEDIMEEVVGEIKDEFDNDEEVDYIKISDNNYIFEGKTLLNDVCRVIGENTSYFDHVRGEADSLAGLLLEMVGHIPNSEKEIIIENITLKAISATKRRIEKISLIIDDSKT